MATKRFHFLLGMSKGKHYLYIESWEDGKLTGQEKHQYKDKAGLEILKEDHRQLIPLGYVLVDHT
jgi:hypothetical protein